MTDSDTDRRHEIALFRYGLIADLVRLEAGSKGLYTQIEQKAVGEYAIPGSTRTRVAGEIIGDWLNAYLIAFIDDATRAIPYAAFALSENTRTFLPVLKQAIARRRLPQRLYVENGANYRSRHLALVCAKLGIALIHARPHRPQGKGKSNVGSKPSVDSC